MADINDLRCLYMTKMEMAALVIFIRRFDRDDIPEAVNNICEAAERLLDSED